MTTLLSMTLSASAVIGLTILLRILFLQKLPKTTFTLLWLIAVFRLLIPGHVTIRTTLLPVQETTQTAAQTEISIPSAADGTTAAQETLTQEDSSTGKTTILPLLPLLWSVGAAAVASWFGMGYIRIRRRYHLAQTLREKAVDDIVKTVRCGRLVTVKLCQETDTPLTYGLFRPVILLPGTLDRRDTQRLTLVLTHELMHIRRGHILYKHLLALAVCLHWFNPLVWSMYILANRDLELVCDQAVLRRTSTPRAYAMTLLDMAETHTAPLSSAFGASAVEERIRSIMKIKKSGIAAITAAVILVLSATTVFAAYEPKQETQTDTLLQYLCEAVYDENGQEMAAPVYYADGTPVVNSRGEQLYDTASDIDRCNQLLRSYYEGEEVTAAISQEDAVETDFTLGQVVIDTATAGAVEVEADGVHWYTQAEFAAKAAQDKENNQAMEGQWDFTAANGWQEWTAADTERINAQLDALQADMESNGLLYGTTDDGTTLVQSPPSEATATEQTDTTVSENSAAYVISSVSDDTVTETGTVWTFQELDAYAAYGITYDEENGWYLYEGEPLAGLYDANCYCLTDGLAKDVGGVYVVVHRSALGRITGLTTVSSAEFSQLIQ